MLPSLPKEYVEYIKDTGGFECPTYGEFEPGYAVLWSFDEIVQDNADYAMEEYAPGFIAFSDGGGELLVFDPVGAVFKVPKIGMGPNCAFRIAEDFYQLVSRLDF